MDRLFSSSFKLLFAGFLSFFLSGCVATRLPVAIASPWEVINLDTQANPLDIGFVDDEKGFLVGTNRLILETNDGGNTWEERALDLKSDENFRLVSIDFIDNEGWVAGQPGLLLHTKDGRIGLSFL